MVNFQFCNNVRIWLANDISLKNGGVLASQSNRDPNHGF